MCGIFGIQSLSPKNRDVKFVNKISSLMHRRGPDATGFYNYNQQNKESFLQKFIDKDFVSSVFLMHKRLSILDLSEAGNQPMQSADGRFTLVYNGEIYNYKEIRQELEQKGVQFYTHCDTEVLLQYLIYDGFNNLQALEGMFAFAFFDRLENKLFLARDPFGIKPLYFFNTPDLFAFSSQINCLLELPEFGSRRLNLDKYLPFLRFGTSDCDEKTLIQNIYRLEPGHCIVTQTKEDKLHAEIYSYFKWKSEQVLEPKNFEDEVKDLRQKLELSVQKHLISDVPVCFNLSGGVDSSALVAIASRLHNNITAFTYAADDKNLDESHHAECVANHCRIKLVKVKINPDDFAEDLDDIILAQGEPYAGSSIYAQRKLYEAQAKEGFKVCIDGQGGDELFAGYLNYYAYNMADAWKCKQFKRLFSVLCGADLWINAIKKLGCISYIFDNFLRKFPTFQRGFKKLIGCDLCPFYVDKNFYETYFSTLTQYQYHSLREALDDSLQKTSIPTLVRYADRNAMSFSIENRVPFLCDSIAQFAHMLPNEYLISDKGLQKYILREAVKDILPDNIVYRKDKMGFPPTESLWLLHNKNLITKLFNSSVLDELPGVNAEKMRNYWSDIVDKNQLKGWRTDIVWRIINMIRWIELNQIEL
ncbi:MAG: asparagine synthase (glutamine-hydrolyzing) [Opitutales bacterium]